MGQRINSIFFALLRSSICGTRLTDEELDECTSENISSVLKIAKKHDISHLIAYAIKQNNISTVNISEIETLIFTAVFRNKKLNYDYENTVRVLEEAEIPFLPLKGAIIRKYYPETWMRNSCDIDILVRPCDLERACTVLADKLNYKVEDKGAHDVSIFTPAGMHIELHFDLVEEDRANNASYILNSVWEHASLSENYRFFYEMSDAMFYFYHIAHMAKHFETGGCGIRPFIDLFILDNLHCDKEKRDALLSTSGLLAFRDVAQELSRVWLMEKERSELSSKMESFIMDGGVYGSPDNRVLLQQKKKGGKFGYLLSRIFIPYNKLKRYYPVLEKHRWLTPVMQIRRWFMLLDPSVRFMAKREISANGKIEKSSAEQMNEFLSDIGLK
jgi:hypothetical protein